MCVQESTPVSNKVGHLQASGSPSPAGARHEFKQEGNDCISFCDVASRESSAGPIGMWGPKVPASPVSRFWKYFDMHGTVRAPWSPHSSRNKTVNPGQFAELNIKIVPKKKAHCLAFSQLITISARSAHGAIFSLFSRSFLF